MVNVNEALKLVAQVKDNLTKTLETEKAIIGDIEENISLKAIISDIEENISLLEKAIDDIGKGYLWRF